MQIKKLYSKSYFTRDQKEYFSPCLRDIQYDNYRIIDFNHRLRELNGLVKTKRRRLLDIGCATGTFLILAKEAGWEGQGIDVSHYAIEIAKKNRVPVRTVSLENFPADRFKFEAITAWEVVPNFENLSLALSKIKAMLRRGGILAMQLTVVDSLIFYISHWLYCLSLGKIKMFVENGYPINHTQHFSRFTLKKALHRYGFRIVKSANVEFNYSFSKLPRWLLPFLGGLGWLSKLLGRTTQYRIYAAKK